MTANRLAAMIDVNAHFMNGCIVLQAHLTLGDVHNQAQKLKISF